ncbi:MAG TPA: sulfatase, partial [Luteolibacter sp.]
LGCYGDKLAKTPNIDRLAARGTLFERAYCNQAVCAPSRNATLTGLHQQTLRIYDLETNFRLRAPEVKTLPQWFKEHGYISYRNGKIFHTGGKNHEDAISWSEQVDPKGSHYANPENKSLGKVILANGRKQEGAAYECADVAEDKYADGVRANQIIERLRAFKQSGEPFFLGYGIRLPHLPFCAPKKYWDMHDPAAFSFPKAGAAPAGAPNYALSKWGKLRLYRDIPQQGPLPDEMTRTLIHAYYASTSYADAMLGRVLDELDKLGLAENTIIVFWGDHGYHLGDHGMWCKHTNYEQATHAPLIISAPGKKFKKRVTSFAEFTDIYPTICELAGMDKPSHLQGDSLVGCMSEKAAHEKTAAFQVWPHGKILGQAVRTERWRYVEWQKPNGSVDARELYDMQSDPGETVNVAAKPENAQIVAEHSELVRKRLATPIPAGLNLLKLDPRN